jgi:hypothetical protein
MEEAEHIWFQKDFGFGNDTDEVDILCTKNCPRNGSIKSMQDTIEICLPPREIVWEKIYIRIISRFAIMSMNEFSCKRECTSRSID